MFIPNVQQILDDLYRPFVEKGAAWLDEYEPKWVEKIIPEDLAISDGNLCICGQVFGDYGNRPQAVEEAWCYGFSLPMTHDLLDGIPDERGHIANFVESQGWKTLDRLWLDEVYWRDMLAKSL